MLANRFRHIPGQSVAYLLNPKVACSSILASMWLAHDAEMGRATFENNPHADASPFLRQPDQIDRALQCITTFSVVRNPFMRFVSAYLDKIARPTDLSVWKNIERTLGFKPDNPPSPFLFLSALADSDPLTADWHFCPQWVNVCADTIRLDFTGRLENMLVVEVFMLEHLIKFQDFRPHHSHATNAAKHMPGLIGPAEAQLIRRFYERDFELYGYEPDL